MPAITKKLPLRLPVELVELIIEDAWYSTARASDYFQKLSMDGSKRWLDVCTNMGKDVAQFSKDRWELHSTLSLVSHQWHEIMHRTSLRHIIIESAIDLLRYNATMHMSPKRMHFHLVISLGFEVLHKAGFPSRHDWTDVFRIILPIVRQCTLSRITFVNHIDTSYDFVGSIFSLFSQLPLLRVVHFDWTPSASQSTEFKMPPRLQLPHIVYFRLSHYPACPQLGKCTQDVHEPACISRYLLRGFPKLRQLHLGHPVFLKFLDVPHSLEVLILDVAPNPPFSSMMGWNIGAALNHGLFKRAEDEQPRRRIVVNTGAEEPTGWLQAQQACSGHEILLQRRCMFRQPDPVPRPPRKTSGEGNAKS
ncbi:hypothetical protein OBBRIDRAFT_788870 [Obba rivulosa]|uniref:Uncharacterized protein n=1 Tax=Obba rivulosa TaxID=1052685 RepID=A0A8E2DSJ4_9APHY|nr:hypothetical protein OBBRIDRAFT_788870 [Obba rivulosa]